MSRNTNHRGVRRFTRGRKFRRERLFLGASRSRRRHETRPRVESPPPTLEEVVLQTLTRLEDIQADIDRMKAEVTSLQGEQAAHWRAVIEVATAGLTRARQRLDRLRASGRLTRGDTFH